MKSLDKDFIKLQHFLNDILVSHNSPHSPFDFEGTGLTVDSGKVKKLEFLCWRKNFVHTRLHTLNVTW